MTLEEPIILFIQGVFITKQVEDSSDESDNESSYDDIPVHFIGTEHWPKTTNILCSQCCLPHKNVPVFIPKYFKSNSHIAIERFLFCSFPCAAAYINNKYSGIDLENRINSLKYIYKIFTNDNINDIPVAPPQSEIDVFGGKNALYNVSKYKKHINHLVNFSNYII
jgi:hypothetical protein